MLENESAESEVSTESASTENSNPLINESAEQPASVFDLDSAEKVKWGGREWSQKELKDSTMLHSDYSRKTQAIAEERKYTDNLNYDLSYIHKNPDKAKELVEQFKSIYPEKFHSYLDFVFKNQPDKSLSENGQNAAKVDPALQERLDKFDRMEAEFEQKKIEAIDAELDAKFQVLSKKYPMADEEAVIARAQSLVDRKVKIDDKIWDNLWKSVNDKNEKLADAHYANKVNKQKNANSQGRDIASGGGTPGQAPKMPRTIKEASDLARAEMENS